jgi:hypothetical protein
MNEINDLNNYIDEISTVEGTDGKRYKHNRKIIMEIKIGFRFSKQHELLGKKHWKTYEVVGSSYGLHGGSSPDWKQREDVLKLKRYVQIMDLPYPNHNGLIGKWEDMTNSQLSIFWKPLRELQTEIEEDMKLLPEFRKYKIDEL